MTKILKREIGLYSLPGDFRKCSIWNREYPLQSDDSLELFLMSQGIHMIGGLPEAVNELSITTVEEHFTHVCQETDVTTKLLRRYLEEAINKVNDAILGAYVAGIVNREGEISSLTCMVTYQNWVMLGDIGINRVYHLCSGQLQQVSIDHSDNSIPGYDRLTMPTILKNALGRHHNVAVEFLEIKLENSDEIIIINDGIWRLLTHQDLKYFLTTEVSPGDKAKIIVNAAKENESKDENLCRLNEIIHDYYSMVIRWKS